MRVHRTTSTGPHQLTLTCKPDGVHEEAHSNHSNVAEVVDDGGHEDEEGQGASGPDGHGQSHQRARGSQVSQEPEEKRLQEPVEGT